MKITDLKVSVVRTDIPLDLREPRGPTLEANLVRVLTDEGLEGVYFAWEHRTTGRGLAETIAQVVKPVLLGQDPFDRERFWQWAVGQSQQGMLPMVAGGAIDVALWDIAGKATNQPIYKLMGAYRDKVRAYASTLTLNAPEDYFHLAKELKAKGYTAMKLHVWGDPDRDLEACRAAREAVGEGMDLMLDAVCVYNRRDALRVGRELEKLNFYWYEEPLPNEDVEGYVELCRLLEIPVAGTERLYHGNPTHFLPYLVRGAADLVRTDARRGITLVKKVADMCAAFQVNCEIHSWGSIITQAANLHVMGAIRNCDFFEKAVPEERFEFCAKDTLRIDGEGYIHLPSKPGLGVELDWAEIEKRTIATL